MEEFSSSACSSRTGRWANRGAVAGAIAPLHEGSLPEALHGSNPSHMSMSTTASSDLSDETDYKLEILHSPSHSRGTQSPADHPT